MTEFIERLSSRKFILTVVGALGATLMYVSGNMTADAWAQTMQSIIGVYITAEGLADIVTRIKG